MKDAFLVFLIGHTAHSLWSNWRPAAPPSVVRATLILATQTPLMLLAVWIGLNEGIVNRGLLSPWYFAAGVLLGHAVFCVSLVVTPLTFEKDPDNPHLTLFERAKLTARAALANVRPHIFDLQSPARLAVEAPVVLTRFIGVAVSEELVWRGVAQPLLQARVSNPWLGILAAALLFAVVHKHFFQNDVIVSVEFLAFSLFLGALYFWTGSLLLVITIHAVRDIEIVYHEYLEKRHDSKSDAEAIAEIEGEYSMRRPATP